MSYPVTSMSILRPWVSDLQLREQGTLLTAVRGCDLTPKFPLDSLERKLAAAIRYAVLVPFDEREVDSTPGCFMLSSPPPIEEIKPSALGHYPWHYVSHLVHAIEILGYLHPDPATRLAWELIYRKFVRSFHFNPETEEQLTDRMGEDRIKTGEIVS